MFPCGVRNCLSPLCQVHTIKPVVLNISRRERYEKTNEILFGNWWETPVSSDGSIS